MVTKIARVLSAGAMLAVLAGVRPAVCEGWSLLPSFSSDSKTAAKPKFKKSAAKKEPSTLEKVGTGTKKFFNQVGETLGLKKPEPKKPQYAYPRTPAIQRPKKQESKSWLGSLFKPEEPKKPKSVVEWMGNERPDL